MDINEIYIGEIENALVKDHAALMIGAGFSKNAEKVSVTNREFLSWKEMGDKFYEVLGMDEGARNDSDDLLKLAQEVEDMVGRPRLEEILKECAPDEDFAPSELHVNLLNLPWRDVFTTNYDTLLERAADKVVDRRYNVVACREDLVSSNDAPRIVKLHGSFPSHRPFIITEKDYEEYPDEFAAFVNTVRQALLENVFCMVGFSCEDPNFKEWIEWTHENLKKTYSPMIYMVSVSHVDDARREELMEQNIAVIDLEELWRNQDAKSLLDSFTGRLRRKVAEEEERNNWKELDLLWQKPIGHYLEATDILRKLNNSYPGWVFLPWKKKGKTAAVLSKLDKLRNFDKLEPADQINYMYEYVRFMDITGRPVLEQTVDEFWSILNKNENELLNGTSPKKRQTIFLQLLRSFRELGDWERYDACCGKIKDADLDYYDKQFLFACNWWKTLYNFQPDNLVQLLNEWNLKQGDIYWPLIKASFYAVMGEKASAETILLENLTAVRKQLVRNNKNAYLSSIEECTVSLINFIRLGRNTRLEKCLQERDLSWTNEDERYYLHINAEREGETFTTRVNFDLSTFSSRTIFKENSSAFRSLEYFRFREQTGHPFRLGDSVSTVGLENTIKYLVPYYPYWCLMQIIIARGTKLIDSLYGRAKLAELTRKQVDDLAEGFIEVLHVVMDRVRPGYSGSARTIFEQAAAILPEILARLCYKCSAKVLDEVLDLMLEICTDSIRTNFKKLNLVFKGLIRSYTVEEQGERIEKFLSFPMEIGDKDNYSDPITYISIPKGKYKISPDLYDSVIFQIGQGLKSDEDEKKESACNRFMAMAQTVQLHAKDKNRFCKILERRAKENYDFLLYVVDPVRYAEKPNAILESALHMMKIDANKQGISIPHSNSYIYGELRQILSDIDIQNVDFQDSFLTLENFIQTCFASNQSDQKVSGERVKESFIIATGLMILQKRSGRSLAEQEKKQIRKYSAEVEKYLGNAYIVRMIYAFFGIETRVPYATFQEKVWLCGDLELEYVLHFYRLMYENHYLIDNDFLLRYSKVLFKVIVHKVASCELNNLRHVLNLCYWLLLNHISTKLELQILIDSLSKIKIDTVIHESDTEQEAINKLFCRIWACNIAREICSFGVQSEILDEWKNLTNDENEFAEIRNIGWTDDADAFSEEPQEEVE